MSFLSHKVIVVTGASSGIGYASALAFAQEGAHVVVAARRLDRLRELETRILAQGVGCLCVKADVSAVDHVQRLFAEAEKKFGRVDILVNNAGIGRNSFLLDTSLNDWKETLDTNLTGVFLCTQEFSKRCVHHRIPGHVITVSSVLGLIALPGRSGYCASKHGVTGFKRAVRSELRKHRIRVSLVHPAGVDTEILDHLRVSRKKWKMLRSEDVAEYIVALASQDIARIVYVRLLNIARRFYYLMKYYPK